MTKEELDEIIRKNAFSKINAYGDDEIGNLIKEVYYDGMIKGYEMALFRLQMLGGNMPFSCCDDYLKESGDKIKRILDAIYE